jgi:tetratricopeptide (TPR) repeat protein
LGSGWGGSGYYGGGWGGWGGSPSYYPESYGDWYSGAWSGWPSYPSAWLSAAAGWLGATTSDSYDYSNPFADASAPAFQSVYNYLTPIPVYTEPQYAPATEPASSPDPAAYPAVPGVVAPTDTPPDAQPPEDPKVTKAVGLFDQGRELFKRGDYAGAQAKVDQAIAVLPQDRVLHEFRALTLVAQGKYGDAAATLYAVLSAGPGWNWDTLKSFYPDAATYTTQLRALETHARENPKSPDDRFVLAYHYLVLGQTSAAIKALEELQGLVPKDQLTAQILAALKSSPPQRSDAPQPGSG